MDTTGFAGTAFLTGFALLLWSLARDVHRENDCPRHWWQNKKRRKKVRFSKGDRGPSECPFGGVVPNIPSTHCGGHHYGGGGDCGGL
jgi:hypothetical protein